MGPARHRTALVAGASGLVGVELVAALQDSRRYGRIHLLGRRSSGLAGGHVREHVTDFDSLESLADEIGAVDDAYCCLGTTIGKAGSKPAFRRVDHDYVIAFACLAAGLGARVLALVSALGADPESGNFYLRVKGETERDLVAVGLPSLVILRPSLLTGDRQEFRLGERIGGAVLTALSPLMVGRLGRVRPVAARDVARAMVLAVAGAEPGVRMLESDEIRAMAHGGLP